MSTCPSPCGDSPLSITSNILSILTFALGLFASYVALISATRGAPAEISRLVEDLRSTQHEINRVAEYIFDDAHYDWSISPLQKEGRDAESSRKRRLNNGNGVIINGPGMPLSTVSEGAPIRTYDSSPFANEVLYEEVQALLKTCITLFYEADDLLKRSQREGYGLRRRILFVLNRNEVQEKMTRLADQKAKLAAVQMSLFLRKSARHDAVLTQIASFTEELQMDRTNGPIIYHPENG